MNANTSGRAELGAWSTRSVNEPAVIALEVVSTAGRVGVQSYLIDRDRAVDCLKICDRDVILWVMAMMLGTPRA